MTGMRLVRGVTLITDHPFAGYIRKLCPFAARDLVCYFVPQRRRFCLGLWQDRTSGRVIEIQSWNEDGSDLSAKEVDFIQYWLSDKRRTDAIQYARRTLADERSWAANRADESKERCDQYMARCRGRARAFIPAPE